MRSVVLKKTVLIALSVFMGFKSTPVVFAQENTVPTLVNTNLNTVIEVDLGHGTRRDYEDEQMNDLEEQMNLFIGLLLKEKLEATGATVQITKEGEGVILSHIDQAPINDEVKPDLILHLHTDGNMPKEVSGMGRLIPENEPISEDLMRASAMMEEMILNKVSESIDINSYGVLSCNALEGVHLFETPTLLVEMGFMTNDQEEEMLSLKEYQQKFVEGIVEGIVEIGKIQNNLLFPTEVVLDDTTFNNRVDAYKKKNPNMSEEEVLWRVKADLDKPEFKEANLLTKEQLKSPSVIVNKRNKVPDNYVPDDLVEVTGRISLRRETKIAFDDMVAAAKAQGYYITPISGFRTVAYQKSLYNRYLQSDSLANVETYSARAGFSEHHTGMAIDVGSANGSMSGFGSTRESKWVGENAHKYGFIVRYLPNQNHITGYKSEPWHLRYVGSDSATRMKVEGIKTLEEYVGKYGF